MSWSLEKEIALRKLTTTYGVIYADALHALSSVEDSEIAATVERLRKPASDEESERR